MMLELSGVKSGFLEKIRRNCEGDEGLSSPSDATGAQSNKEVSLSAIEASLGSMGRQCFVGRTLTILMPGSDLLVVTGA